MKPTKTEKLYGKRNYWLLTLALATVIVGYFCLAAKPKDGTLTMYVAPILLVIGYCVLMPIALFLKPEATAIPENEKQLQK